MTKTRLMLTGCGILKKEIEMLIAKNHWPIDTFFLDSSLHINFEKLADKLNASLDRYHDRHCIVFYGACHPLMEGILKKGKTFRTPGQNCVDILLGNELFSAELEKGAFFLMEDWAKRWEYIIRISLGNNLELIRDIYQEAHKYLLCLRTPVSRNFMAEAEDAGRLVGLPIKWLDVSLDHLESVLLATIARKWQEIQ